MISIFLNRLHILDWNLVIIKLVSYRLPSKHIEDTFNEAALGVERKNLVDIYY